MRAQVLFSKLDGNTATVPMALLHAGTVYVAATSANSGVPTDSQLLSGLAILDFTFQSTASQ